MKLFSKYGRSRSRNFQKSNARHRFVPDSPHLGLERRQLLAAGAVGINLTSLGYVDLMKETRPWTPLGSSTLPVDANGWPMGDAQIVVLDERVNQSFNGPDANAVQPDIGGTYHLSFQGKATVTRDWLDDYTVQNQVYNSQTNTTTADLVVTHNSLPLLLIDFYNTVNPASANGAGVSNVKLIQPGYAADTTQVFTNSLVNAVAPFGTLRYLNIDNANNYPPTYDSSGHLIPLDWSQRKLPTNASQVSGPGGAGESWEYMIALANATNTDMWINIPGPANDGYVAQLANLIKSGDTINGVSYAGLNPNLKVNLEYSNETWGGIYNSYSYVVAAAQQEVAAGNSPLNNDGVNDSYSLSLRYYLERTEQVTNIFRNALGSDPTYSRIRPVLGYAENSTYLYTAGFPWFEKTFGAPNQFFYGMGDANYAVPTDYSSVDNEFASLNANLATQASTTKMLSVLANYYGLQNVAYEGGPDTSNAANSAQQQVALLAARDPRMEQYIQQLYDTFFANGGNLAMAFDGPFGTIGPGNQYAIAELAQANNPTAAAKYRGFVDLAAANPQPVTVGTNVAAVGDTGIPITADSNGQSFSSPTWGQTNDWLLNVATAGTYNLTLQSGSSTSSGQVQVSTSDTNILGTVTIGSSGTYNLGSLVLKAGLNTLFLRTLSPFKVASLVLTSAPVTVQTTSVALANPGFEFQTSYTGSGDYLAYRFNPTGSAWTFNGLAGVSANNSTFTSGNPNAPEGSQVGFIQNQGSISQTVSNWTAGSYQISLLAAERASWGTQNQSLQVLIDGQVVSTITPTSTTYQTYTTAAFTATAGVHKITFQGMNASGDASSLIDSVKVAVAQVAAPTAPTVANAGFEFQTSYTGSGDYLAYRFNPTGSAWTFNGLAGVSANNSTFTSGNPNAPEGSQVGFIQNQGSISQTVSNWTAGSYQISLLAAERASWGTQNQSLQVLIDGQVVSTITPTSTTYQTYTTAAFTVTTGIHKITFQGMNASGDASSLIDSVKVAVAQVAAPTAPTVANAGFEFQTSYTGSGDYLAYRFNPTGSAWTFNGLAGVSANNSTFTSGNPNAPEGSQVGFIQNQGSISQTVSNWTAGSYQISLLAAEIWYDPAVQLLTVCEMLPWFWMKPTCDPSGALGLPLVKVECWPRPRRDR